ncbi:MAG: transposon-encoded TnpW family protein [Lachnospiraceae bacterium]|nr:transposon-encoded TnpW family protein [Lachnospiraceae bacterium]
MLSEQREEKKVPTIFKKIGGITYRVRVHFNEKAKEDMQQKIERMIRDEVKNPSKKIE